MRFVLRTVGLGPLAFVLCFLSALDLEAGQLPAQRGNPCAAVWDLAGDAQNGGKAKAPWRLVCPDGDPTCDIDLTADGTCHLNVNVCLSQTLEGSTCAAEPLSAPPTINKAGQKQLTGFVAPTQLDAPVCGTAGVVALSLRGKKKTKPSRKIPLRMAFSTASGKGRNILLLQCGKPDNPLCPAREPGLPSRITFTVPPMGTDLDNGFTGTSHNFPVVLGSTLTFCLTECDATTNPTCHGEGSTGPGSVNGETFGAPLPLLAAGVPVCVVNRFKPGPLTSTIDLQTGQVGGGVINLFSDVYITNSTNVCPRCEGTTGEIGTRGRCAADAKQPGTECTVQGKTRVEQSGGNKDYVLSGDCVPVGTPSTLDIALPLTTETATSAPGPLPCAAQVGQTMDDSCAGGNCLEGICTGAACATRDGAGRCIDGKGGLSQACCDSKTDTPCFMTRNGGTISRTGQRFTLTPPWGDPTYPKRDDTGTATNVAVFCEGATDSALVNVVSGLPGPGAVVLSSTVEVVASP